MERAALRHRLETVGGEVPHHLTELRLVHVVIDGLRRVDLDGDLPALGVFLLPEQGTHLAHETRHVHAAARHALRPGVGEEVLDDVVEPLRLAHHDVE